MRTDIRHCVALHEAGRLDEAIACYRAVLTGNRRDPQANHLLGLALFAKGAAEEALRHLRVAAERAPHPRLCNDVGNALRATGRQAEALAWFRRAIEADRGFAEPRFNLADCLLELRRFAEALAAYDAILAERLAGIDADFHANRGAALLGLGRPAEAEAAFRAALALAPRHGPAAAQLGLSLLRQGREAEAEAFLAGLAAQGTTAEVMLALGQVLLARRENAKALACFERLLAVDPRMVKALIGRGVALHALLRHAEAVQAFDAALAIHPNSAEAWSNRGVALKALGRLPEAVESYRAAIRADPDHADAHINLGNALLAMGAQAEAIAAYRAAIARQGNAEGELGRALTAARDLEGATRVLGAAAERREDPRRWQILSSLLYAKLLACDWDGLPALREELAEAIRAGRAVRDGAAWAQAFELLAILDDPALHQATAERMVREGFPMARFTAFPPPAGGRIRLGYVSSDLRRHPVGYLMARILERHDRDAFEVHVFSTSRSGPDEIRDRIAAAVEHFHECGAMADEALVGLVRALRIDIAIDLNGYTGTMRTDLFARGLAPVQVNFLGFPGTMGAPFMDYILADPVVIPPENEPFFTEKVARLPHCYLPGDDTREIAITGITRARFGLPEDAFVFCAFHNAYKIQPEIFDIWMRILAAVPDAVLWLRQDHALATRNLQKEAAARGIDPARLIFAEKVDHADHLARHALADLFLDTLPYNAHATAMDALGVGLPVLTRPGRAFAGRVGASLLHAVGLPELIAETAADYEGLAIALATDRTRLGAIRARLAANLETCPLFDSLRFTRDLERAFRIMHERRAAGLPPEGFSLPPAVSAAAAG
jgi:predicted O-linked N-acetylglucosamine transferase (SPINDLY family)